MRITSEGGGITRHKFFAAALNVAAKPCDYCKSAVALLFCRADSAFMCIGCDAKVHNANVKHERVWMCEVCEHAPAAVTCKADAAALCVTCDRDIHSANPLASRHDRVPVLPFYDTAESVAMKSSAAAATLNFPVDEYETNFFRRFNDNIARNGYVPSDSWMPPSPIVATKLAAGTPGIKSMELFLQDSEQFLDLDTYLPDSIATVQ